MVIKNPREGKRSGPQAPVTFVDNPELHDPKMVRALLRNAEQILAQPTIQRDQEIELFKAMHACGYLLEADAATRRRVRAWPGRLQELQERLRGELTNRNIGLVYDMLRHSPFAGADEADLISAGFWALFRAVAAFDPWRGFRFSTYACNAIVRGFQHVGKRESRRRSVVQTTEDAERLADAPTTDDFATPSLAADRLRRVLDDNAAGLTPTERYILERRFLYRDSHRADTLQKIGDRVQLSKERVRQIQEGALAKLRSALRDDPVMQEGYSLMTMN